MPTLRALLATHQILAVVSQPDRPAGRGKHLTPTPVKALALAEGLLTMEPLKLRGAFQADVAALGADAAVVVSYGRILPAGVLALGRYGAYNLHPSALPLYRGAMPIAGPIRDGCTSTDVCVMLMDEGLDTGDVVIRRSFAIEPGETGTQLHDRLAIAGAGLVLEALSAAESGTQKREPQAGLAAEAEIAATFTRPLAPSDLLVDWAWTARRIVDFVRAYAERPTARAELAGERVKLLRAALSPQAFAGTLHGEIGTLVGVHDTAAIIRCGDGTVAIERLVPPNRGAQDGAVFARARIRMESHQ